MPSIPTPLEARKDAGFFFNNSRRRQAVLGAIDLGKTQGRIVNILITRIFCGPPDKKPPETRRIDFGRLLGDKDTKNIQRALADLVSRQIVILYADGEYTLNEQLDQWEGVHWPTFKMLWQEFQFLEKPESEGTKMSSQVDKNVHFEEGTKMSTGQKCPDEWTKMSDRADKNVQFSGGLREETERTPPNAPQSDKNVHSEDQPFDPDPIAGSDAGIGATKATESRWWIRAGIGWLELEKGKPREQAREIAIGIASWCDRRNKAKLDPVHFAFAMQSIAGFWNQADDRIASAIHAYKDAEFRRLESHPLLDRWLEFRGEGLYLPSLELSQDDSSQYLIAKEHLRQRVQREHQEKAQAKRAEQESLEEEKAKKTRIAEARRRDDLRRAFISEKKRLSNVSDRDLLDFAKLFHPSSLPAMQTWLEEARGEPDSESGLERALDILRGFDLEELREKRADLEQRASLEASILEYSAPYAGMHYDQIKERASALSREHQMAIRMLALRGWQLAPNSTIASLEITRDAMQAFCGEGATV